MQGGAQETYQRVLDAVTAALMENDREALLRHMQIPHFMTTSDGRLVLNSEEDVIAGLADFFEALKRLNVKHMDRRCDTARLVRGDTIVGFHTTQMTAEDGTLYPAYPVRWVLHQQDGRWRVSKTETALSETEWRDIPHNTLARFEKAVASPAAAQRVLVQTILDRIDSAFMSNSFEGWFESVSLPLVRENRSGQQIFETRTDLLADFDLYQQELSIHQVTDLTRVVTGTEMIDAETMRGTYTVHVLSGSQYVVPPWEGSMLFRKFADRWRIAQICNALGHLNWTTETRGKS